MSILLSPITLVALFLLLGSELSAQTRDTVRSARPRSGSSRSTTPARAQPEVLSRAVWPLAGKYSFGSGIGLEYNLFPAMSVEINTSFIAHSAKARIFLMRNNVSPFLSAGIGFTGNRYGTAGTTGKWIEAQAGVERAFGHGFMRVQLHYTVKQSDELGFPQFAPDFTLGYRF